MKLSTLGLFFSILFVVTFTGAQVAPTFFHLNLEKNLTLAGMIASEEYTLVFTNQGVLILSTSLEPIDQSLCLLSGLRPFPSELPLAQAGTFLSNDLAIVQDSRTGKVWMIEASTGLLIEGPNATPSLFWFTWDSEAYFIDGTQVFRLDDWTGKKTKIMDLSSFPLKISGTIQPTYQGWGSIHPIQFDLNTLKETSTPLSSPLSSLESWALNQKGEWLLEGRQLKGPQGFIVPLESSSPGDRALVSGPKRVYLIEYSQGQVRSPRGENELTPPGESAPLSLEKALEHLKKNFLYPQALRLAQEHPRLGLSLSALRKALVGFGRVERYISTEQIEVQLFPDISYSGEPPVDERGTEGLGTESWVWEYPLPKVLYKGLNKPHSGVFRSKAEETWYQF